MIDIKSVDKKGKFSVKGVGDVKKTSGPSFEEELGKVNMLEGAFDAFNKASESLKEQYGALERRVGELNRELAEKSVELEENLKKTSRIKRYQSNILESLASAVVVLDQSGTITTFNRKAEEITGFLSAEIKGKHISELFSQEVLHIATQVQGVDSDLVYQNRRGEQFHLRFSSSSLLDERGLSEGKILILHDITKEKRLEESLERGKKLATMGEMAAKLAHEIRNPLGGIELFASNLKKHLYQDPRARGMAENISNAVASLNHLVSNTLQYAKMDQPLFKEVDVVDPIEKAIVLAYHLIERQEIRVTRHYSRDHHTLICDSEMMKQVFLNLILNAVQAMEDGGELHVSIEEADGWTKISVRDSGKGISEIDREKIFDPFYSTKEKGSGLGLAIVGNILDAHKGRVDIRSAEGCGTEIVISLPSRP